jgi:hypothetical protein
VRRLFRHPGRSTFGWEPHPADIHPGFLMPDKIHDFSDIAKLRAKALARWDNEGGASRGGHQEASTAAEARVDHEPQLSNAELVHLQVRVIALENLMLALLADGSDCQVEIVREMAAYISPSPGFTPHRLTTQASAHMIDLAERPAHFRAAGDHHSPSHEADTDG